MPQFNAIIATQTDHWRGTSAISVLTTTDALPQFRAIDGAVYGCNVTGGVSGSFAVYVLGSIGGTTYTIAGLTNIGAAGARVLYPTGYTASGTALLVGIGSYNQQDPVNIITNIVPPSAVVFESNVATAGISASVQVSAVLSATR